MSRSGSSLARGSVWKRMARNKWVYILFLPSLVFLAIFCYSPLYGLSIAFKDFKLFQGIAASDWVGFKHFETILTDPKFYTLLKNTLVISGLRLLFCMPIPIIFALMINEVRVSWFKKSVQVINYFPYFLSWVVFGGVVFSFTGPDGMINQVLKNMGMEAVNLTTNKSAFLPIILITDIIKNTGWSSIIYMSSIVSIDPQLYEAATIDGGGKMCQLWHVTLPGMRPIICFQYCMAVANILNAGFEQIFMFLNATVYDVGDVLDTYIYRMGLLDSNYEIATAMGLMKGIVGLVLIVSANAITRKIGEKSLW